MYSDESEDDRWLEALAGRVDPDVPSFAVVQATAIRAALLKRRDEIEADVARLSPERLLLINASLIKEGFLVERKSGLIVRVVDFLKARLQSRKDGNKIPPNPSLKVGQDALVASVWRINRSKTQAEIDKLPIDGLDDFEIPAFLRRQTESRVTKPKGKRSTPGDVPEPLLKAENAVNRPASWVDVLPQLENLMRDFDIAAATSPNFRVSLIKTLRDRNTDFLMWLWNTHMDATKASAPIWAVFISWLDEKSDFHLSDHARKHVSDFVDSLDRNIVLAIQDDLNKIEMPVTWLKK
jgi:hypothetical protein